MGHLLHVIDAFASGPFTGNPAAVCMLPAPANEAWMQKVAAEMNLSETAFLVRRRDGFELRWFTPTVEIELCGHATLASAHFLYTAGLADPSKPVDFHTKSGLLRALPAGGGIELSFPKIAAEAIEVPSAARDAIAATPVSAYRAGSDLILELADEASVRAARPNMPRIEGLGFRAVGITARGDDHDFVSRFFAPRLGIPEDPVTGGIHCALGPLWASKLGKDELRAFQASARGGELLVVLEADRCHLVGCCFTTLRAELAGDAL
jgi:PhzF family phenazine biosynthesis protein